MKRNTALALAVILILPFAPRAASAETATQTAPAQTPPFVADLLATARGEQMSLSWKDSPDARGPLYIFRSAQPFAVQTIEKAVNLGEVPYGAQSYIDKPPTGGTWYYFVMATDLSGTVFGLYTDSRNVTGQPVTTTEEPQFEKTATVAPAPVATPTPEAAPAPVAAPKLISALTVQVRGDAVVISFTSTDASKNALLYRSAAPITRIRDLLNAVIVQAAPAVSPFTDYPIPGIPYYYALVSEDELKGGSVAIETGGNATNTAVEVQAGLYRIGLPGPSRDSRSMPLPLIATESLSSTQALGSATPAIPATLSPAASRAVSDLLPKKSGIRKTVMKSQAFPQDLEAPAGGEDYTLRSIVQQSFARREWPETTRQLSSYLSLPRSAIAEARARYYLGQSYYFQDQFREALFEFLLVQNNYPAEAGVWIRAILKELK